MLDSADCCVDKYELAVGVNPRGSYLRSSVGISGRQIDEILTFQHLSRGFCQTCQVYNRSAIWFSSGFLSISPEGLRRLFERLQKQQVAHPFPPPLMSL